MLQITQIQLHPTRWLAGIALLLCLASGVGGTEMWTELFEEQLDKAEDGDADAQYEVGIMYLKGQGVEEDRAQAVRWLESASVAGNEQAAAKLRRMDDQRDKFTALEQQARAGDVEAQYEIGMMYLKGRGVEKEQEQAYVWLGKAAKQGYEKAITRMGILHQRGEVGEVDYEQAHALFDSVKDESVLAQYYLGEMYANGQGVEQDYATAIAWYQKAADGGFSRALGKIINLQEEQEQQQRRRLRAAPESDAEKPAAVKVAAASRAAERRDSQRTIAHTAPPLPRVSQLEALLQKQWLRGSRPVDYLPSAVTECNPQAQELVCFSTVLTRNTGNQTVEYRVRSTVRPTKQDAYAISYRNLVLDVVTEQDADNDDLPGGYDNEAEQGFRIKTGWTNEHTVDCNLVSGQRLECTKDGAHDITLVAG
jgi:TPR repeat protein